MKRVLFLTSLFLATTSHASYNGWNYQRIVQVSSAPGVTSSLTNFPVIISTNVPSISTTTGYGHMNNAYDQGFFSDSNCQYELNWDTVTVNNTGVATENIWVQAPTLSSQTLVGATFYWCYGNSGVTSYIGHSTGTWDSNYFAVYHFGLGVSSITDSTSNGYRLTSNSLVPTLGLFGGGYNGGTALTPTMSQWNGASTNMTASLWFNTVDTFYDIGLSCISAVFELWQNTSGTNLPSFMANGTNINGTTPANDGAWHYEVGTYADSGGSGPYTLYMDGASAASGSHNFNSMSTCSIGQRTGGGGYNLMGTMSELRLSTINRSADWVKTEYTNEKNTAFVKVGSEQGSAPPSTGNAFWFGAQ